MFRMRFLRVIAIWLAVGAVSASPTVPAYAQRTDVVLFRGFGQGGGSGMDILSQTLLSSFTDVSTRVFAYTEQRAAFDFINSNQQGRTCLVLIGYSFGGASVIGLADDYLRPNNFSVDLTVQIDSVDQPTQRDDVLPPNVRQGVNYFQIATGTFESQGERNVRGAANINVEELFNDRTIDHSNIDDDMRLHNRIVNDVAVACDIQVIPEPGTLILFGTGALGLLGASWRRRKQAA